MTKMEQLDFIIRNINYAYEIGDRETMDSHERTLEKIVTGQPLILGGNCKECSVQKIQDGFTIRVSYMSHWTWASRTYFRGNIFEVIGFLKKNGYNMDQGE